MNVGVGVDVLLLDGVHQAVLVSKSITLVGSLHLQERIYANVGHTGYSLLVLLELVQQLTVGEIHVVGVVELLVYLLLKKLHLVLHLIDSSLILNQLLLRLLSLVTRIDEVES